jgi:DNA-binding NarL/FixJ family response regulator
MSRYSEPISGHGALDTSPRPATRRGNQATWESTVDLASAMADAPPAVDAEGLAILRLLAAGRKDEAAARTLRMSPRTYRRRVAELMALLGAESRFQAGVRAKTLGLPV